MPLWLQSVSEWNEFILIWKYFIKVWGEKTGFGHHDLFAHNYSETYYCKPPRIVIFNLSLLSHTLKTVVTLTQSHTPQSHTPTTTVSQRTHRPTDKHLCQQTHTTPGWGRLEKFPSAWVTFHSSSRLPVCLSLCPSVDLSLVSYVCSQALSSQKFCLFWGRRRYLMTNLLFVVQQNRNDFADVYDVFSLSHCLFLIYSFI